MTTSCKDRVNSMYWPLTFTPDHFNREILTWKEARPDIRYIFSKDILKSHRAKPEDATYIKKEKPTKTRRSASKHSARPMSAVRS